RPRYLPVPPHDVPAPSLAGADYEADVLRGPDWKPIPADRSGWILPRKCLPRDSWFRGPGCRVPRSPPRGALLREVVRHSALAPPAPRLFRESYWKALGGENAQPDR